MSIFCLTDTVGNMQRAYWWTNAIESSRYLLSIHRYHQNRPELASIQLTRDQTSIPVMSRDNDGCVSQFPSDNWPRQRANPRLISIMFYFLSCADDSGLYSSVFYLQSNFPHVMVLVTVIGDRFFYQVPGLSSAHC